MIFVINRLVATNQGNGRKYTAILTGFFRLRKYRVQQTLSLRTGYVFGSLSVHHHQSAMIHRGRIAITAKGIPMKRLIAGLATAVLLSASLGLTDFALASGTAHRVALTTGARASR
jgi:hypothetical protein